MLGGVQSMCTILSDEPDCLLPDTAPAARLQAVQQPTSTAEQNSAV